VFVLGIWGSSLPACGQPAAGTVASPEPVPGQVVTAVGTGQQGFDGDGQAGRDSWLNEPTEVGFDEAGQLYIVDWNNHRIRARIDGKLATVVGTELPGDWPSDVDATDAVQGTQLSLNHPMDIAFTSHGGAYLAAWHNHKLLSLDETAGSVRRVAGGNRPGYAGDGASAVDALLNFPESVVLDSTGAVLVSDQRNNVIRRIAADDAHTISTIAGIKGPSGYAGDAGPAGAAALGLCPYDEAGGSDNPGPGGGLALDADGNLYVADTYNHCVRRISAGEDGVVGSGDPTQELVDTVAGECGTGGFDPDPTPQHLLLREPRDIEVRDGVLYIADSGNSVIVSVTLETGKARRVVGTGKAGLSADGAPPLAAALDHPYGLGFDGAGNLFIADTLNHRVVALGSEAHAH
jgi:sugar lactone lactonase YvrE